MKVAVFLNLRFYEYNDEYRADEQYFKFWIRLAEKFTHMTLCVPVEVKSQKGLHAVSFDETKVSICPLPMYKSSSDLYLKFPYFALISARRCVAAIREADLFVAVVPNLLGLFLSAFARRNGTPCMFYIRGNLENTVKYEYRQSRKAYIPVMIAGILDIMARRQMKKYPAFVVGKELYYKYLSHGIQTIPIITSLIQEKNLIQFVPKKNWGKEVRLLTVGRLSAERGIETLLKSVVILNRECPIKLTCKIIGDGPDLQYLQHKAKKISLQNVLFAGYIPYGPEMVRQYREADIFVLPSHTEGFPKVLLEAMAHGVPVVSTSVGGIPYALKSGYDAILVRPKKPEAIVEGISKLVNDIDLYNKIGINATQTVKKLSFEKQSNVFVYNACHYVSAMNQ